MPLLNSRRPSLDYRMAFHDLQSFIRLLEARGQLVRVTEPVSHDLEITEIADRLVKVGGPAVLFENVIGKDFPVVIGLMGTRERMAWEFAKIKRITKSSTQTRQNRPSARNCLARRRS